MMFWRSSDESELHCPHSPGALVEKLLSQKGDSLAKLPSTMDAVPTLGGASQISHGLNPTEDEHTISSHKAHEE